MKQNKPIVRNALIITSVIVAIILISVVSSLIAHSITKATLGLETYHVRRADNKFFIRYLGDQLNYVGDNLFWSVESSEATGVVYVSGVVLLAHGNRNNAIYYWYPFEGGKDNAVISVFANEKIDCEIKNNIFGSIDLMHKSGNAYHQTLDAPISAYAFCEPYTGYDLPRREFDKVGTISLEHAEIEWLHMEYTVYCISGKYYCNKLNGVYEDGEYLKDKTWFVLTDEALVAWFSEQQD